MVKKYTLDEAKQICINSINNLFNNKVVEISDWEFDTLLETITSYDKDFNVFDSLKVKSVISSTGKISKNFKKCPICNSLLLETTYYNICENIECIYWKKWIFKKVCKIYPLLNNINYNEYNIFKKLTLDKKLIIANIFEKLDKTDSKYLNVINKHLTNFLDNV